MGMTLDLRNNIGDDIGNDIRMTLDLRDDIGDDMSLLTSLIPKLAIVVFGVHYEPLNSN